MSYSAPSLFVCVLSDHTDAHGAQAQRAPLELNSSKRTSVPNVVDCKNITKHIRNVCSQHGCVQFTIVYCHVK